VAVEFIGVRAGEKLHEELWGDGEESVATAHPKILRAASRPVDPAWLYGEVAELARLVEAGETVEVVARLAEMMRDPHRLEVTATEAEAPAAAATPPRAS
jgi:FlaA1/EpsC-like NDP-sugar epimerase